MVGTVEPRGVRVEGVAVVHQELPPSHQPEARPDLVAKLRADLVEGDRELAVGGDAGADHRGDRLLGRGREAILAALAVLQVKEDLLGRVTSPAAAFLPELPRLQDRGLHLEESGAVHLFPDDRLGLAVGTQAQRRQRVHSRRLAPHHAGPRQEDMGDRLGVARNLADRLEKVVRPAHFRERKIPEVRELSAISSQLSAISQSALLIHGLRSLTPLRSKLIADSD